MECDVSPEKQQKLTSATTTTTTTATINTTVTEHSTTLVLSPTQPTATTDEKDPLGVPIIAPNLTSSATHPTVISSTSSSSSPSTISLFGSGSSSLASSCQLIRTPPGLKAPIVVQKPSSSPLLKDHGVSGGGSSVGRPRHTHHLRKPVPKVVPLQHSSVSVTNNHRPMPSCSQSHSTSTSASMQSSRGGAGGTTSMSMANMHGMGFMPPTSSSSSSSSGRLLGEQQASTMREVLASIPGFNLKTRRRSTKKMSTAAQIAQTHEGCIDLETPDSILVGTNLRALLNINTFSMLPPLYQYKLIQLLPSVDRPNVTNPESIELKPSSLNNEFFARACVEWQNRLAEGEFTPENQLKLKSEAEKEKSKLDPWKLKHFEPIWGDKGGDKAGLLKAEAQEASNESMTSSSQTPERPSLKTTIKLRPTTSISSNSAIAVASTSAASSSLFTPTSSTMVKTSSSPVKVSPSHFMAGNTTVSTSSPRRITRTLGAVTRAAMVHHQQSPLKAQHQVKSEVTAADSSQDEEPQPQQNVEPSSIVTSNLKRQLSSSDPYDESVATKLLKQQDADDMDEVDETISVEVTTYDPNDDDESVNLAAKIKQHEESLDSEPYSEPTHNAVGHYNEESLSSGGGPKSMESSNGEMHSVVVQNQNEDTLQDDCEDEEIQYIYQNDASCGANEDVAASNSSSSLNNQINMHDYHQPLSSGGEEIDDGGQVVMGDNQIEVISCDNVVNEIISERSASSDGTQGCSLSVGASIELGHQIKHHQSHLEELGISVSNEEIVTDHDDTEPADDLIPSIQNIPLDDPEQMDEHLTDAVNYVLESEEMMETGETSEFCLRV